MENVGREKICQDPRATQQHFEENQRQRYLKHAKISSHKHIKKRDVKNKQLSGGERPSMLLPTYTLYDRPYVSYPVLFQDRRIFKPAVLGFPGEKMSLNTHEAEMIYVKFNKQHMI